MPIIRLTANRPARFVQIGTLRKGAPKPERGPGRELPHFRFDSDDQGAMDAFTRVYGTEPKSLTVLLPFPTLDENWSAWQEAWTASKLAHRCDGEMCYGYGPDGQLAPNGQPCPDKDKPSSDRNRCKPVGRLMVILPGLERFAYVLAETHSINDIVGLTEQLQAIAALSPAGTLTGIPLRLSRVPREISTPHSDQAKAARGERMRVLKHLLSIEVDPEWARHRLAGMQSSAMALAATPTAGLLPGPTVQTTPHAPALAAPAAAPLWDEGEPDEGDYSEDDGLESPAQIVSRKIEQLSALWTACQQRGYKIPDKQRNLVLTELRPEQLDKLIEQATGWLDKLVKDEAAEPAPVPA